MAFRFPLNALRRVRAIYERRERRRLEVLTHHLMSAQEQLATLRQGRLEEAGLLARSLKEGMTGAELRFQVVCSGARLRRIDAVAQVVESVNQQRKRQLIEYRQARQKLEVIERLYERQFAAYRRTRARRDQQQATDLFLICSNTFANFDTTAYKN
jgi:flagellar export protein FliJ